MGDSAFTVEVLVPTSMGCHQPLKEDIIIIKKQTEMKLIKEREEREGKKKTR